jgi:hypothetical protein
LWERGNTRGGAARLATDRIHQPTRGRSGLGRPGARSGGPPYRSPGNMDRPTAVRWAPHQSQSPARAQAQGGGPPCPLHWAILHTHPIEWAAKDNGLSNNLPMSVWPKQPASAARWRASGPSPPRGGRRSPKGGSGGLRGQPAWHECFVSHPDKPPVPFALTPALSHSHPRSVSRESFGGRGGDARRCRSASHRSDSPTDARSVGSGAAGDRKWGAGDE